jgi:hypothetical protein
MSYLFPLNLKECKGNNTKSYKRLLVFSEIRFGQVNANVSSFQIKISRHEESIKQTRRKNKYLLSQY